jgi:hypothetical protein
MKRSLAVVALVLSAASPASAQSAFDAFVRGQQAGQAAAQQRQEMEIQRQQWQLQQQERQQQMLLQQQYLQQQEIANCQAGIENALRAAQVRAEAGMFAATSEEQRQAVREAFYNETMGIYASQGTCTPGK